MSQAPGLETEAELLRMAQGLRDALGAPAPVALSRRIVAGFRGKARMYFYPPKDGGRFKTPLVLFPYLGISRPYIFDLRPGESFARRRRSGSCSSSYGRHSEKPANGLCRRDAHICNHHPPHQTGDDDDGNPRQDELPAGQVIRFQGTILA